jgi:23S rRNA pseudouridine1911/1915/1917 synthase
MVEEEIPAALAGERLDRIVALIAECSRNDAQALLGAGGVWVDGEAHTIGKLRLKEGQVVRVDPTLLARRRHNPTPASCSPSSTRTST